MMDNSCRACNGNEAIENDHVVARHTYQPSLKGLPWLDIRVFYVRVCKCEFDDSTPGVLALHHLPLYPDTLLEVNGVRTGVYSDGEPGLLKRDRIDRKSEEATFVSTDSIRMSGTVKFEVFDKDVLLLSGVLELCSGKGFFGESSHNGQKWSMKCESDIIPGISFLKGKNFVSPAPTIEVYVAGSFLGTPIILTETLQVDPQKKLARKRMLDEIPENETSENHKDVPPALALQAPEYLHHKPEDEYYNDLYSRTSYVEGEDGELSWFNAGLRVGVGIGLSVCVGIGIGVGLLVKTYQGTARNFGRRLF